ncbi:MAG: hypothetical protein KDB56_01535 [Mycobacterium sp.]|nr:hypothetical protein [Mycobacterium sp.]
MTEPRKAGAAAHAARPPIRAGRLIGALAAGCAVLAAVGVGAAACLNHLGPSTSAPTTARSITVTPGAPSGAGNAVPAP